MSSNLSYPWIQKTPTQSPATSEKHKRSCRISNAMHITSTKHTSLCLMMLLSKLMILNVDDWFYTCNVWNRTNTAFSWLKSSWNQDPLEGYQNLLFQTLTTLNKPPWPLIQQLWMTTYSNTATLPTLHHTALVRPVRLQWAHAVWSTSPPWLCWSRITSSWPTHQGSSQAPMAAYPIITVHLSGTPLWLDDAGLQKVGRTDIHITLRLSFRYLQGTT